MPATVTTIALCDDHPLFRLGLAMALTTAGFDVVAKYGDVRGAVDGLRAAQPDVLLLDLILPDGHGFEVLQELGPDRPALVVVVTTVATPALWRKSLDLGCQAILEKDLDPHELVDVIKALVADPTDLRWRPRIEVPSLSEREANVLAGLARGWSNPQIARALGIGTETVKDRVADLFDKLDVRDRTAAVVRAQQLGLVLLPPSGGTRSRPHER